MILAPSRSIEGWLYPDVDHDTSGAQGAGSGDAGESVEQSGPLPLCAVILPNIATDRLDFANRQRALCPGVGAGGQIFDQVLSSGASIPFRQDPDGEFLPLPNLLPASRPSATNDPEYLDIFGQSGSVQRCVEQFIESGFSPRKPVRLERSYFWQEENTNSVHEHTEVCVIWVYQNSRAA